MNWDIPLAGGRTWLIDRPQVMAILNATPDSFSDGGKLTHPEEVKDRVREFIAQGADCLDVGGESTRPGFTPVSPEDEIARVLPVIAAIRSCDADIPISIDTSKAAVAQAALEAGACFVNDVSGAGDPAMPDVVARHGCAIVLMRHATIEGDMVAGAKRQLAGLVQRAEAAGVPSDAIILDPGLGFGDRPGPHVDDNLALLRGIDGYGGNRPVLIGHSRKRFVAQLGEESGVDRDAMTATLAREAADAGAAIVRVHDVAATVRALA